MKDEVKAKLTSEQVAALEQVANTTSTMGRMCVPPSQSRVSTMSNEKKATEKEAKRYGCM
jgi:hypothetical protein